ncbi:MAG: mechanosensitive ion channel family protein [SAR324 cluster bacterium]|nr:mechanosensitive ion channel family protein [SAR324 cluster bacterium]
MWFENYWNELNLFARIGEQNLPEKIFGTIILFFLFWSVDKIAEKILSLASKDSKGAFIRKKLFFYLITFFLIILLGKLWLGGLQPISTFLGITAAALVISQKETLTNFMGWIFIQWRHLFSIGDRIEIVNNKGDVVDIGIFYFTLMEVGGWIQAEQSSGRLIKIPNSLVLNQPIANYIMGFPYIWHEIPVYLDFSCNWQKAEILLRGILDKCCEPIKPARPDENYFIIFRHMTPTVYTHVSFIPPKGLVLTLRYLCNPRTRRDTESRIWKEILETFKDHEDVRLAIL